MKVRVIEIEDIFYPQVFVFDIQWNFCFKPRTSFSDFSAEVFVFDTKEKAKDYLIEQWSTPKPIQPKPINIVIEEFEI